MKSKASHSIIQSGSWDSFLSLAEFLPLTYFGEKFSLSLFPIGDEETGSRDEERVDSRIIIRGCSS